MIDAEIHEAIDLALALAIQKHGHQKTPLSQRMSHADKLIILVEEVGEVARALTYDEGSDEELFAELIQLAAMSASWAQAVGRTL